jgi:hypothetical protein
MLPTSMTVITSGHAGCRHRLRRCSGVVQHRDAASPPQRRLTEARPSRDKGQLRLGPRLKRLRSLGRRTRSRRRAGRRAWSRVGGLP